MMKSVVSLSLLSAAVIFLSNPASAGGCPEKYNYLEFGSMNDAGDIIPGGPAFRVVENGKSQLAAAPSCHKFSRYVTLTEGFEGVPVPVVATFSYDPSNIAANLKQLGVTRVLGNEAKLDAMADPIRAALRKDPSIDRVTGAGFTCYSTAYATVPSVVCDLDNRFDRANPIAVSCDKGNCEAIKIATLDDVIVSASWSGDYSSPAEAGAGAADMMSKIFMFYHNQIGH